MQSKGASPPRGQDEKRSRIQENHSRAGDLFGQDKKGPVNSPSRTFPAVRGLSGELLDQEIGPKKEGVMGGLQGIGGPSRPFDTGPVGI